MLPLPMSLKASAILAISLLLFAPLVSHSSSLTIYYNGTVTANANNGVFYLIGNNVTPVKVNGGNYTIKGNVVYFTAHNVTISYVANFSGVIKIIEPYNLTVTILLPSNSSLTYINPAPLSFKVVHGLFNFTFYSSNVLLLYSIQPSSGELTSVGKTNNNVSLGSNSLFVILILTGLVVTNSILGYTIYSFRKNMKKTKVDTTQEEKEGDESVIETQLNDRDLAVLNAIKSGASTLSEIMKVTNLPKTTTYRRVKKLVSLGYVQEIRKDGKIYYVYIKKD